MLALPRPKRHPPSRLRRGVSALWNETDGGGWWPCCCTRLPGSSTSTSRVTLPCGIGCVNGQAPFFVKVDVSGVVVRTPGSWCTSGSPCTDWNGSYILPYVGIVSSSCTWRLNVSTKCGSDGTAHVEFRIVNLTAFAPALNVDLAQDGDFGTSGFFIKTPTTQLNCMGLSSVAVPFSVHGGSNRQCDFSGATVLVTSL